MFSFNTHDCLAQVVQEVRASLPSQDRDAMQEALDMLVDRLVAGFAEPAEAAKYKAKYGHTGSTDWIEPFPL